MTRTEHSLTVAIGVNGYRDYTVTCPEVTDSCRAYSECGAEGCDGEEIEDLADGDDEFEHHGVIHHQIHADWLVPLDYCWLTVADLPDSLTDQELPVGAYRITKWTPCRDFGDLEDVQVVPRAATR